MQYHQLPARLYYCAKKELAITDIPFFAEEVMDDLQHDLRVAAVDITGPPEFHYFDIDLTGARPFYILIAFPVTKRCDTGRFSFLETEPFSCLTTEYRGPMAGIGEAWSDLVNRTLAAGYLLQNQGREVYREWLGFESDRNLTELQLGVAARWF